MKLNVNDPGVAWLLTIECGRCPGPFPFAAELCRLGTSSSLREGPHQ